MSGTNESTALSSREARKWAMICHIIALVGLLANGVGYLLGPLIVWLLKKEDDPFIDEQGKEAVNFQITMFIALFAGALLLVIGVGILLLIAVGILMTVFPIIGAVKANEGVHYRYPLSYRFIK
ncbi:MAG: DUF4870 domain-containing protein [Candidatus Krumholzibacteria bacterium]|nr:DUF4870 domain-containing protein [Candidatus Krumholzibacteria bacterium]